MPSMPEHANTLNIRVYYEDTDAGGVVYYANYLKFMERARTEWLRALGVDQTRLAREARVQFVVHSLTVDYRAPARLDDVLTVHSHVTTVRRASLVFGQRVARSAKADAEANPQTLVEASVQICCVHTDTLRAAPLPDALHTLLAQQALT